MRLLALGACLLCGGLALFVRADTSEGTGSPASFPTRPHAAPPPAGDPLLLSGPTVDDSTARLASCPHECSAAAPPCPALGPAHPVPPDPVVPPTGCSRAEGDLYHVNHLNHLLHQALADGDDPSALHQAKRLGVYCIACILVEEGRPFRGPEEGPVDASLWHAFTVNGVRVQFPRGERPLFDELYDAFVARRRAEAMGQEPSDTFQLGQAHLAEVQALFEEADAYLSARVASHH